MKKHVKILTVAMMACLLTAALIYSGCKKAELEKTGESTFETAEAGWGDINNLLNQLENETITLEEFLNQLEQVMATLEGGIESLPPGLRRLPDKALLGMINSSKPDIFKVSMLLLQSDISETVAIAASEAGLKRDMLTEPIPPVRGPINTVGVTVTSDQILMFESEAAFESTMNSLVNHAESDIDSWESEIGFTSMRRNFEMIKEDPTVDDLSIDTLRIGDVYFESIVNSNGDMRVADTIYNFDFGQDLVMVINAATGDVVRSIDLGNEDRLLGACSNNIVEDPREIQTPYGYSLVFWGRKWSRRWLNYASVGAYTKSYKKTATLVKAYPLSLHLMIDQWYHLKFRGCFGSPPYNIVTSVHYVTATLRTGLPVIFSWNAGFPLADRYEVPEWGRTHHWGDQFFVNEHWDHDVHLNTW